MLRKKHLRRAIDKAVQRHDAQIRAFVLSFAISLPIVILSWFSNLIQWSLFRLIAFVLCMAFVVVSLSHSATCMKYGGCHQYATFLLVSAYSLFILLMIRI